MSLISENTLDRARGDHAARRHTFPVEKIRADFPILAQKIYGKPLAYLDNAATTQKPAAVIARLDRYYREENANIHRGVYYLSERATEEYEKIREKVKDFLNARDMHEIVFVRGTTEGINLVAATLGARLSAGDEVLISEMEHHSNIVPWQLICEKTGAKLKVAPINEAGEIIQDEYEKLLNKKTKIVSLVHVSNALGTINPVKGMIQKAHAVGAKVLIDGAQAVAHLPVDVQDLDCDFYVFSGHKVFAPTGVGALYGRAELLDTLPPYQGGGDMIKSVTFEKTTFNDIPYRFEAGTPNIAGAAGLGAALDYLQGIAREDFVAYESELLAYGTAALKEIDGVRLIGTARDKASVLSFVIDGVHPHDVGTILDREGICIRAGHHCAQPVMKHFNVQVTVRASLAFYNTKEEIDRLVRSLEKVREVFK